MLNKNMKLLMENFKSFLDEANIDPVAAQKVAQVIDQPYPKFVTDLSSIAADPKVKAVIDAGLTDGKPDDEKLAKSEISPPVTQLKPTQNEIDLGKSLGGGFGPLQKLDTLELFLKGGDVLVPSKDGAPVATAMGGRLIIDGHHRWSSLYCINSEARVKSVDLSVQGLNPLDYLKIVQLTIASMSGKIPVQGVEGTNLIGISENVLKSYVIKNISEGAVPIFAKYGKGRTKEQIADFIWSNVQSMNKTGIPVSGAPKRDYMPQTDNLDGWPDLASSGKINFKEPAAGLAEKLEKRIGQLIAEEMKRIKNSKR